MRRALHVLGLSGALIAGFASAPASAQDQTTATDSQHNTEEPKAAVEQAAAPPPADTTLSAATTAAVTRPKVGDISTSGYFRGGFGATNHKGRMTCFQLALEGGLLSKYRLGNECEVWAEAQFNMVTYVSDDGAVARLHFMPTAFIPNTYIGYSPTGVTSSDQGDAATGATVAFPNLYVDMKGISWLAGGTPWIGTRYYKRESIYISDFFYWNPSGVGGGVEDIELAQLFPLSGTLKDLKLSLAVFAVDGQPGGTPKLPPLEDLGFRADVQLRGLSFWEGGEFQLGFQYIQDFSRDHDVNGMNMRVTNGGWGATARFVQQVLGGNLTAAVQYGKGGGTGFGTLARFYYPDFSLYFAPAESRLRALGVVTIQPIAWFGTQFGIVYQHDDLNTGGAGVTDWFSIGDRLSFALARHFKVLAEGGFDRVQKGNGAGQQFLGKGTLALAITGDREFMSRPELRLFGTYAIWNDLARIANVDSGQFYRYSNYLSGATFGLQAETWW